LIFTPILFLEATQGKQAGELSSFYVFWGPSEMLPTGEYLVNTEQVWGKQNRRCFGWLSYIVKMAVRDYWFTYYVLLSCEDAAFYVQKCMGRRGKIQLGIL
jgi:hypothetical protein